MSVYKVQIAQNEVLADEMRKIIKEKDGIIERLLSRIDAMAGDEKGLEEDKDLRDTTQQSASGKCPVVFVNRVAQNT